MYSGTSDGPVCEVRQALAYLLDADPSNIVDFSPCGGLVPSPVSLRGTAAYPSMVLGASVLGAQATVRGPIATFWLCGTHRSEFPYSHAIVVEWASSFELPPESTALTP
jgi:hypothetical protein